MKSHGFLTRVTIAGILILAAALVPAIHAQDSTTTAPAISATSPSGTEPAGISEISKAEAGKLAAAGWEHALSGNFAQGLKDFTQSAKAAPADASVAAAIKLLDSYETVSQKSLSQRTQEYKNAVEQVELCLFAQKWQPRLAAQDGLDKKLRNKIMGASPEAASAPATSAASEPASAPSESLVGAYNRTSTSEALGTTLEPALAQNLQNKTVKALDESRAVLAGAAALLKDNDDEYAKAFRKSAAELDSQLKKYQDAWKDARLDDAKSIDAASRQLRKLEDDLADSLADVETLVIERPFMQALVQARAAVQLLPRPERDKATSADWYRQLMDVVTPLAATAMEKQEWSEALGIYTGLQELAPDVEEYHDKGKIAQRHVRVIGLYGPRKPTATTSPEDEPTWKDLVSGVDVEMVRAAISQLDENYVTAPDYRKLAHAALQAIKVLATTPQAKSALPTLGDDVKREAFVKSIDELIAGVDAKKRMDQMDLQFTLNDVIQASESTVAIRKDVLSVEFMDGCLEELDKFSNMIWPYEVQDFTKTTMGNFFGVGIQIAKEPNEPLKVVSPLEDSPAYRAGIKSGDMILAVDGVKTEPLSADALVKRITGPENTKVVLTVKRPGAPPQDYELIRQQIKIKTVKGWQRKGDDWDYLVDPVAKIGYIRLTQFTDQTAKELDNQLKELKAQGVHSLILDLRFNPGGLLRSAGAVADEFLKEGRIVSTRGRQSGESKIDAEPAGNYQEGNLVVLVNQYSASAAEIVSGALKDLHRATVIGQRSYGKGSVQNVVYVGRRKAILKVTNAYYYLPSGRCLHRKNGDKEWGVDPDIDVLISPRQMKHWLDIRRKTELLQDVDARQLQADMAEQFNADIQLSTAVTLLKLTQLQKEDKSLPVDYAEAK